MRDFPAPLAHRERREIRTVKQTDDTVTLFEPLNGASYITTDTLVEIEQ